MEKPNLPQLIGEVTKDSVASFVNETRFALEAPSVINELNAESIEKGRSPIELPSRTRMIGESALRNSNGLIGGIVASVVLKTALRNFKLPLGG